MFDHLLHLLPFAVPSLRDMITSMSCSVSPLFLITTVTRSSPSLPKNSLLVSSTKISRKIKEDNYQASDQTSETEIKTHILV